MSEAFVEATPAEIVQQKVERVAAIQQEFSQKLMTQKESLATIEVLNDQSTVKIQCASDALDEALRHGRHFRALCLTLLILCVMLLVFLFLCPI